MACAELRSMGNQTISSVSITQGTDAIHMNTIGTETQIDTREATTDTTIVYQDQSTGTDNLSKEIGTMVELELAEMSTNTMHITLDEQETQFSLAMVDKGTMIDIHYDSQVDVYELCAQYDDIVLDMLLERLTSLDQEYLLLKESIMIGSLN